LKHYETLMLLRTEATGDEVKFLQDAIEKRVAKATGEIVAFDKWGKLRLAYPVQKQEYGQYILARYSLPDEGAIDFDKELNGFFKIKCGDFMMRAITVALEGKPTPDYKKPEAVDAAGGAAGGGRFRGRGGPHGARGPRSSSPMDDEDDEKVSAELPTAPIIEDMDNGEEN
jgi:small subunit ribosomal protein S6